MVWDAFTAPAYRTRSASIAADQCINRYVESVPGHAKKASLYWTPGLKPHGTVPELGTRETFSQDGRTFAVVGGGFYEETSPGIWTRRGDIPDDGLPATIVSNGRGGEQLMIVGGGVVKIFTLTTNVLSGAVVLPLTNRPVLGGVMDTYFFLLEADTIRVWFCALNNGLLWNALDFFARSHTSDNLVTFQVFHDRILLLGSQTGEVFYNSGDLNTPFVPYPGTVFQDGASAVHGCTVLGEAAYWLAEDNLGRGRMMRATAYSPEEVSTPAIGFALAHYPDLSKAEAMSYTQEGHEFVCWTFPSGDTWCFDAKEGAWHQRNGYDQAENAWVRWRARGACATPNGILTGDFQTGSLYLMDLDTFTDNGLPRKCLRRAPYLSDEPQWIFVHAVELLMEAAVGLLIGQGALAQVMLRVSKDAAQSWSDTIFASMGTIGTTLARCLWRNINKVRSDRLVLEISQTDPVGGVWGPGLNIRATPGTGQL